MQFLKMKHPNLLKALGIKQKRRFLYLPFEMVMLSTPFTNGIYLTLFLTKLNYAE